MTDSTTPVPAETKKSKDFKSHPQCSAFYGLGLIGALIYYITTATSFWGGVLGVLKAIVWPALLVFHWLKFLEM